MTALSELSILIVTWNGDDLLKNCLDSVLRACGDVPEIVVVDNANLESTKALVATYPNAKYIAAPENLGFAGGNNLGLPLCTRPYVLLLNNDTIVHEEPFTQLIQYLKDHPKVAVVQGKMRLVRFGDVLDECGSYLTSWGEVYSRGLMMPIETPIPSGPSYHAKGACLMFKKEIVQKLGGILFHGHFRSNFEDVDFCHRVWLTGNEVHFVNTPPIDHLQNMTVTKVSNKTFDARSAANRWFCYATTLEPVSRFIIGSRIFLMWMITIARFAASFDFNEVRKYFRIYQMYRSDGKLIRTTRRQLQSTRTMSDRTLFRKLMVFPPLLFHLKYLHGISPEKLFDLSLTPNAG